MLMDAFKNGDREPDEDNDLAFDGLNFRELDDESLQARSGLLPHRNLGVRPLFDVQRFVDIFISQGKCITDLAVSNNVLFLATDDSTVLRWNLETDQRVVLHVSVGKGATGDVIRRIFVDPTGQHLLVSTTSKNTYYHHPSLKQKIIHMSKLKDILIESVGWNLEESHHDSTGQILVGTSEGLLYMCTVEGNKEKHAKLVFNLQKNVPICGIAVKRFASALSNEPKWFVMVSTPQLQFQFIGGPSFNEMFVQNLAKLHFKELPGSILNGELKYFSHDDSRAIIAHLTGAGVYCGNIVLDRQICGETAIEKDMLIPYSRIGDSYPCSIEVTEFHILVLYPDRVLAFNQVSMTKVFEHNFEMSNGERVIRFTKDRVNGTLWLFSIARVWELVIVNEDRDMWWLLLEAKEFDKALMFTSPSQRDIVINTHAEFLFSHGRFDEAALVFSKSSRSFSEIALLFIRENAITALKLFLTNRLTEYVNEDIGKSKFLTQRIMISTWIVEIYLDQLNEISASRSTSVEYGLLVSQFREFLSTFCSHLHRETIFELISSHGLVEEMLWFASLVNDFDRVIDYFIQQCEYADALSELEDRYREMDKRMAENLFYKYCPILIRHLPRQMVTLLISIPFLDPCRLLPALMRYDVSCNSPEDGHTHYSLLYVKTCIERSNRDPALHNYLISLYAKIEDEFYILEFIASQRGQEVYDMKYALRLCHQEKKTAACVELYFYMELFTDAVHLSLQIKNFDKAKEIAFSVPEEHPDVKNLWLLIVGYFIELHHNDVAMAISILKDCEFLSIEDILHLFPETVQIADFKVLRSLHNELTYV